MFEAGSRHLLTAITAIVGALWLCCLPRPAIAQRPNAAATKVSQPPPRRTLAPTRSIRGAAAARPSAISATPKNALLETRPGARPRQLPTELVFEGLPANAVTIRSLISRKKLRKALKVTDMVLKRRPRNTEVGMQRARILYWLKRTEQSERQATAVYRIDRYNTQALRLVGDIRLQRGDTRGAIRAYREAVLRGDAEYDLRLRLIDLYIGIDRADLAESLLRPGMLLPDELAWRLARALYKWEVLAFAAGTAFMAPGVTHLWQRAQASMAYAWNKEVTLMLGVNGERRGVDRTGSQVIGQLFFNRGRLSGDMRLALSPLPSDFLPAVDGWAEAIYDFGRFGLGGWIRYASYPIAQQISLGPYAQVVLGRVTIKPGYLLVIRGELDDPQFDSTLFLRTRYQHSVHTALFSWLYYGQESVFTARRRLLAPDESALALVAGADHWFGMRWGLRGMVTAVQYLQGDQSTLVEFLLAVRARF